MPYIFVIKASERSPPWIKVALPSIDQKYKLENLMSNKRKEENQAGRKHYNTAKLTPMEFRQEEKDLRQACINKLMSEWIEEVTRQGRADKLVTDPDYLGRFWQLRVKWKTSSRFSSWTEVQDPIHRHSWAPVNLELSNHFRDYDFSHVVPCPMTRQKILEDPAYLKPRAQHSRDFSIFLMSDKETEAKHSSESCK
jgi:hypothetical protein